MSNTVIVAVITSLSTLTGGFIAGFISLKVQAKQIASQADLAAAERGERRLQRRQESRKEVYVMFLDAFSDVEEIVYRCWHEDKGCGNVDADISKLNKKLTKATMDLSQPISRLAIEGPIEAWRAAYELWQALFVEMTVISEVACRPEAVGKILATVDGGQWTKSFTKRELAKQKFVSSLPEG